MAKNIRWQIPFVSLSGVHYRIDIYDEGTFTPVTLTGGTSPFTTSEDDSDDYFAPIRTQTGTIEVCTLMPDGNYITLDDLLPANNIARPVRLVNVGTGAIEWQGFLSCEAYDQDYTSIPQIIQLPVISVLEAMASVEVDQSKLSGLNTVGTTIQKLLEIFIDKAGISYFSQYYLPTAARGRNIISKYIDATVLFEQKEYNNENSVAYIIKGLSIKDCLERIAVYMGWCCREVSGSLYFFAAGETSGYRRQYRQDILDQRTGIVTVRWMVDLNDTAVVSRDIVALLWAGVDHKRTVSQGAKSVEIVANLKRYELNIEIPDCPVGSLSESYYSLNDSQYLYELGNSNTEAYSNCTFATYGARCFATFLNWEAYWQSTFGYLFVHMAAGSSSTIKSYNNGYSPGSPRQYSFYAGAFLAKYCWEDSGDVAAHNTKNALHCIFFPRSINAGWEPNTSNFDETKVDSIFSISSVTYYRCNSGYLRLFADADTIFELPLDPMLQHYTDLDKEWLVAFELKFGNSYWNGSSWQSSRCHFNATMTKSGFKSNWENTMPIEEVEGLLVPITSDMNGIVTLKVWPLASTPQGYQMEYQATLEMIFSELSVEHILPDNDKLSDRSANHYYRLLGTNFRDEISVGTDLASMLNNQPSPSLIMNSATEAMTELNYGTTQVPDMRRPEVNLLNRLATYYGAARQRLELIVAHPTAAPLPLLRLNGINDGKVYLPLSESRDWKEEVCTLTCFETNE